MALIINKLFSSKKKVLNKHQDGRERPYNFSQDQVRIVLFRECDFRGRKLLFDSQAVQKVPLSLPTTKNQNVATSGTKNEIYVETSNGYGYQYTRPSGDIIQLGEMVFGSVAMSFRGTSFKIHSFSSPAKLMCTQVFPSPRHPIRGRQSVTSHNFDILQSNSSFHSLEKSLKLDYSSASSTTSFTDQTSAYPTESDLKITSTSGSVPLDVPSSNQSQTSVKMAPSLEGDSGFCGEQSYSSLSSGPPSVSLWDSKLEHAASVHGFSCGSLYKRWLRSASTSLDYNACSDSSLSAGVHSTVSADECMVRGHRSSKLGLAVIISLTEGQEIDLERFLLEHSALIESMVHRARSGAESAYTKPPTFASIMYEISQEVSQWLVNLITGPNIATYLWHSLGLRPLKPATATCDSFTMTQTKSESCLVKNCDRTRNYLLLSNSLLEIDTKIGKSVRRNVFSDKVMCDKVDFFARDASLNAERFVGELCGLLEAFDTKHTNFFISTLLTAVLTHHLGWVSTVLPPSQTDKEIISKLPSPCNPLWGQLSDLYGAVGSPTKISHTIICGNNKNEIISKILFVLTYFIRCSIVERKNLLRCSPNVENFEAENIFNKNISFKKENKFYEEFEMSTLKNKSNLDEHINLKKEIVTENKSIGLTRTKSCLGSLKNIEIDPPKQSLIEKVTELGISAKNSQTNVNKNLVNLQEASEQIRKIFQPKTKDVDEKNVIFVLGENDELIGLKKSFLSNNNESNNEKNIPSCSSERPKELKIPQTLNYDLCRHSSTEKKIISPKLATSSSKIVLTKSSIINLEAETGNETRRRDDLNRSQSVPPSDKKCSKNGCKKKYSGVKFDFKQYPQIVTNYLKNKNLELSQSPFSEKSIKLNRSFSASLYDCSKIDFTSCDCEPLQTPSNASELEFSSEFGNESTKNLGQGNLSEENNAIFQHDMDTFQEKIGVEAEKISFVELPMPRIINQCSSSEKLQIGYTHTLLRGISEKYISDMVLQGVLSPPKTWENILKRDLTLAARKPILDQPVQEAVAVIGNIDNWEIQLVSSHTHVVERGAIGVRIGMSQLVANMLESFLQLRKLRTPPEYCLMHIEAKLREFCTRSKVLAQLLTNTDFCNMDFLTSSLQLEVNDVPLLMAVASTHTPQVTQKYGLSFQ